MDRKPYSLIWKIGGHSQNCIKTYFRNIKYLRQIVSNEGLLPLSNHRENSEWQLQRILHQDEVPEEQVSIKRSKDEDLQNPHKTGHHLREGVLDHDARRSGEGKKM